MKGSWSGSPVDLFLARGTREVVPQCLHYWLQKGADLTPSMAIEKTCLACAQAPQSHSTARLGIVLLRTCDPCFYVSVGFCSACKKVPRRFEPRSLDSESRVLTVTRDQLSSTRSSFPSLPGRCTRLFLCCATSLVCLTTLPPTLAVVNLLGTSYHRGYGATVARLTPDEKVQKQMRWAKLQHGRA